MALLLSVNRWDINIIYEVKISLPEAQYSDYHTFLDIRQEAMEAWSLPESGVSVMILLWLSEIIRDNQLPSSSRVWHDKCGGSVWVTSVCLLGRKVWDTLVNTGDIGQYYDQQSTNSIWINDLFSWNWNNHNIWLEVILKIVKLKHLNYSWGTLCTALA